MLGLSLPKAYHSDPDSMSVVRFCRSSRLKTMSSSGGTGERKRRSSNSIISWSDETTFFLGISQKTSTCAVIIGFADPWREHTWVDGSVGSELGATSCHFSIIRLLDSKLIKTRIAILTSPFELVSHQLASPRSSLKFSLTPHSTTSVGQSIFFCRSGIGFSPESPCFPQAFPL